MKSLLPYSSCLFSRLINEDFVDFEKPDGICSMIFVADEFSGLFLHPSIFSMHSRCAWIINGTLSDFDTNWILIVYCLRKAYLHYKYLYFHVLFYAILCPKGMKTNNKNHRNVQKIFRLIMEVFLLQDNAIAFLCLESLKK